MRKWMNIAILLLLGISAFSSSLIGIIPCEKARSHPLNVQATISVSFEYAPFFGDGRYSLYLTYEHDGTAYDHVYYSYSKNDGTLRDHGKVITVAVNPDNPAQLITAMANEDVFVLSLFILCIGLTLLIYGSAMESASFRAWRLRKEKTKYGTQTTPDYLGDMLVLALITAIILYCTMAALFPHTMGWFSLINSL